MLRSSLGFHTMTLSLFLTEYEMRQLLNDFIEYKGNTEFPFLYRKNGDGIYIDYLPEKNTAYLPTDITITYNHKNNRKDRGIRWHIFSDSYHHMGYILDVTINPKILGDVHDYITAATYCDMKMAIICFNDEMKRISPLLRTFYDYNIKRVDYCINFYLKELAPECNQEQIINLLKRSDILPLIRNGLNTMKSHVEINVNLKVFIFTILLSRLIVIVNTCNYKTNQKSYRKKDAHQSLLRH